MKHISIFVLITVAALTSARRQLTEEQLAKMKPIIKECRAISGATEEMIDKVQSDGVFTDDPKMKKQVFCFSKKAGLMNESGDFVIDAYKERLRKASATDEEIDEIIKKCLIKKDEPEETAFHAAKCVTSEKENWSPVD